MARILYAASGDGFGHAVRLHSVGEGLIQRGHDVQFLSSAKTCDYLRGIFPDRVHDGFGLFTIYNQGKVEARQTIAHNLRRALSQFRPAMRSLHQLFDRFRPHLVITDFEPFSASWARIRGIPFISLDNQHVITHCALGPLKAKVRDLINAYVTIRLYFAGAQRYLISTFFDTPIRHHPTRLIPPILRPKVFDMNAGDEGFILAYKGAGGENDVMRRALEQYERLPIRAYGFGVTGQRGRTTFKGTDPDAFLRDLATCRAVIATAGHSLVCEAIHFEKPMLLLPVKRQYEQILNAFHVQRLGLGRSCDRLTSRLIDDLLEDLDRYRANLSARPKASLDSVLRAVEREIP